MKEEITIIGIIEKTVLEAIAESSQLTISVGNKTYFVEPDKKYGFIKLGQKVKVKGLFNPETNEIENPKIEWV